MHTTSREVARRWLVTDQAAIWVGVQRRATNARPRLSLSTTQDVRAHPYHLVHLAVDPQHNLVEQTCSQSVSHYPPSAEVGIVEREVGGGCISPFLVHEFQIVEQFPGVGTMAHLPGWNPVMNLWVQSALVPALLRVFPLCASPWRGNSSSQPRCCSTQVGTR